MKIVKRKRSKRNKDSPQDILSLTSSSTEKEIPVSSGRLSEVSEIQDRHKSKDRERNTAKEMETTQIWACEVNLREGDNSETAEATRQM